MSGSVGRPENPLTDRESRIIEANAHLPEECPNPDCEFTPEVADLTSDGTLYVVHEEDGVGMQSRSPRGETDGCRIDAEHDYTLD
jgi:hypothetical protein